LKGEKVPFSPIKGAMFKNAQDKDLADLSTTAQRWRSETEKFILEDLYVSLLSQF